ncbi:MAG: LL-diaminopimelate aminotransferase [Elusimicrobiota bacterium]
MSIEFNKRLGQLPPYLFAEIDRKKKAALARGIKIISLGIGDPDLPTPKHIIDAIKIAVEKPEHHQYPFGAGLKLFRETASQWMQQRFGINMDPMTEVHAVIGSKEAIGHFPLAFINPDDTVLIPEPAYPVYQSGTIFAGGKIYFMPLKEENNYLPNLDAIPLNTLKRVKLIWINYPNNPTGAVAPMAFYEKVVALAKKHGIIIASDNAYSEMYYDEDNKPGSIFQVPGAKDVAIEFHSLSKTYNMTGWRIGWVCGNKDLVAGLAKVKDNYDSGVFNAVQEAGVAALSSDQTCVTEMRKTYRERRDIFIKGLNGLGWSAKLPMATFYVWCKCPRNYSSAAFVGKLLDDAGIVCTPGVGFGPSGEGYVRFALTVPIEKIMEALKRMSEIKL